MRTDEDGPGVEDEAEAGAAAETGGQQPSLGETAPSSRDRAMPFPKAIMSRFENIVASTCTALERTQPTALRKLDVRTFTGQAAGKSVIHFLTTYPFIGPSTASQSSMCSSELCPCPERFRQIVRAFRAYRTPDYNEPNYFPEMPG
ncbi:hypothetical protein MTO96_040559 [Rhipicephalus appendiculatus]